MIERCNIRYFRKYIWLCFLVWLSACSSSLNVLELPKQSAESRLFKLEQIVPKQETSLLVIQFEQQQWRWSQTDPLGAPISRLILDLSGWKNDGFIAPNKQAQQLFSAIATGLNPSQHQVGPVHPSGFIIVGRIGAASLPGTRWPVAARTGADQGSRPG